jgi:hypothetical protein
VRTGKPLLIYEGHTCGGWEFGTELVKTKGGRYIIVRQKCDFYGDNVITATVPSDDELAEYLVDALPTTEDPEIVKLIASKECV